MTDRSSVDNQDYSLTHEQELAFRALERAYKRCQKVGLYVWDNYGTISAVNGNIIASVAPDYSYGEPLDLNAEAAFQSGCWHGSNADDQLFVRRW